jgi:hypothetical protein
VLRTGRRPITNIQTLTVLSCGFFLPVAYRWRVFARATTKTRLRWQEFMKALFRRQTRAIPEGRPTLLGGSARS